MHVRLFLLQSAQLLFDSSLTRLFSVVRFTSARSAAGLGRRDMVDGCRVLEKKEAVSWNSLAGAGKGEGEVVFRVSGCCGL